MFIFLYREMLNYINRDTIKYHVKIIKSSNNHYIYSHEFKQYVKRSLNDSIERKIQMNKKNKYDEIIHRYLSEQ